jgi:hypothetical protein
MTEKTPHMMFSNDTALFTFPGRVLPGSETLWLLCSCILLPITIICSTVIAALHLEANREGGTKYGDDVRPVQVALPVTESPLRNTLGASCPTLGG